MRLFDLFRFVWAHPLNAEARIAALVRVARWQIASRLLPGPVALPFVDSARLFVTRGMTGATGNWYCGLHEHREMGFLLHVLREADLFLDVGANVGSYTILASGAVGARSVTVEPVPSTFVHLQRNVALNGLGGRVQCWQGGLAERSGTLRFTTDFDTVNHVLTAGERGAAIEVPVTTLDELVGDEIPALIKIDVEGYEWSVLKGARRALADPRVLAVIMETNGSGSRYGVSDDELVDEMRRFGFAMYTYDPVTRVLTEAGKGEGNTIFVRDVSLARDRVREARRFRLVNGSI